jgi:hypothetical protein
MSDATSQVAGGGTVPIGTGFSVQASSNVAAPIELRINNAAGLNTLNILKALERLGHFIRQRGYITGSGGPTTPAFSDAAVTGNTHSNTTVDTLSANVLLRGWQPGFAISGSGIPAGATIAAIAANGLSLTLSAAATTTVSTDALTVTNASLPVAQLPV